MAGKMDIGSTARGVCSILIVLATHAACQGGDCLFRFHLQPNANLSCNPYHQDTATTLHVTCLAIGPLQSALQVEWWSSSSNINNSNLTVERVDIDGSSDYRVIETETIQQAERLISSALSITIATDSERQIKSLCLWCRIQAPGNVLVEPTTSNQLCIKEPDTYSHLRVCNSQEVVDHNFSPVCVQSRVQNTESLDTQSILEVMSTSHFRILGTDSLTFSTPLENHIMYTPTNTPSAYKGPGIGVQITEHLATTITPHLLPSPTKETRHNHSGLMLSNTSLIALYTAAVVCVLLAVVVLILIMVVMVMCRRHSKIRSKRTNNSKETCSGLQTPSKLGLNTPLRACYNKSQLLYTGGDSFAGELKDGGDTNYIKSDIRCGSEQDVGRGSVDVRSCCGSREPSLSTEKSNSLSRKNSMHKYAEIDTISHTDSIHSKTLHSLHASHGDGIHQLSTTNSASSNGFIPGADASKVIPPPPNTRSRSSSTPHFYYILEKLDDEGDRGIKNAGNKLKTPWELSAQREEQSKKSNSREGSTKNRSGSLKRDTETTAAAEFCWGDGSTRSRSGSCPSRERKGGSLKRIVISREGSSKSSTKSSRNGSGKKTSSSVNGSNKTIVGMTTTTCSDGSREGSVKSRGSRDGSFKKEVWVPTREQQTLNEMMRRQVQEKRPHRDYDILEPRYGSHPPLFSIINESYFDLEQDNTGMLFDDPKYAAVSVGDLPQLINERHQSLDPIIPQRKVHHQRHHQQKDLSKSPQSRAAGISKMKAVSSKSLQDSGVVACNGSRKRGSSIYQTRDSTPNRDIVMGVNGDTPSRLSMPAFDAY